MSELSSMERRINHERLVALMDAAMKSAMSLLGIGVAVIFLTWKDVPPLWVVCWALVMVAALNIRARIAESFLNNPGHSTRSRLLRLNVATFFLGCIWGSTGLLLKLGSPALIRGDVAIMVFLLLTVSIYGISQYGAHIKSYLLFATPIFILAEIVLLMQGTTRAYFGSILLPIFAALAIVGCRATQAIVLRNLELRIRNDDLVHSLKHAEGSAEALGNKLRSASYYDAVTGLPNRSYLTERLEHALTAPELSDVNHAIMHINLDNFRRVNESMGRDIGDELLRDVGNRLRSSLRTSDLLAHLGADEFAILLEKVNSPTRASQIADKLIEVMAQPFLTAREPLSINCTVGICLYPEDGNLAGELIKHAETAMVHAKRESRQPVAFYTHDMQDRVRERMEIEQRLRVALTDGELEVRYQPQHHVSSRRLVGLEALLRWEHPKHGAISPAVFVAVAEEAGLVPQLDHHVLDTVFRQTAEWNRQGVRPKHVSINLSAITLRDSELTGRITKLLEQTGARPDWFDLELTESVFLERDDRLGSRLQQFREMGFRLSLDDFGTGYSSLGYLRRFPMDVLKIDRSFIMDVTTDPSDAAIVRAIISMAHHLNLVPIAEGVENEEQLNFLSDCGCDMAQGFLFNPAISVKKITEQLA